MTKMRTTEPGGQWAALARAQSALRADGRGQFCFVCGAADVVVETTPEGEMFVCKRGGHSSPRAFIFEPSVAHEFAGDSMVHETAGAVVRRKTAEVVRTLLFLRQKFPFAYTIPAGHIEVGRTPYEEMAREVTEETGLVVSHARKLWPAEDLLLEDPCRRGADLHRWHVFEVEVDGVPQLSDEARIMGWFNDDEIRALADNKQLTGPTAFVLGRLIDGKPFPGGKRWSPLDMGP